MTSADGQGFDGKTQDDENSPIRPVDHESVSTFVQGDNCEDENPVALDDIRMDDSTAAGCEAHKLSQQPVTGEQIIPFIENRPYLVKPTESKERSFYEHLGFERPEHTSAKESHLSEEYSETKDRSDIANDTALSRDKSDAATNKASNEAVSDGGSDRAPSSVYAEIMASKGVVQPPVISVNYATVSNGGIRIQDSIYAGEHLGDGWPVLL